MTEEQVREFIADAANVDGECPFCLSIVLRAFARQWPEWIGVIDQEWTKRYSHSGGWVKE